MNRRDFIRNATGISGAIMAPALAAGMEPQKVAASTTRVAFVKTMDRAAALVAAHVDDDLRLDPELFLREDELGRDGAVVEEALQLRQPAGDELTERGGDGDVPAGDFDAHVIGCQLSAVSYQPRELTAGG